MTVPNFPGNSKRPDPQKPEDKKVERVTTSEVLSKKKSLSARFGHVIFGGDTKSVVEYVVTQVLLPQAREMITEAVAQGFERLVYGETRGSGYRPGGRPSTDRTPYNRYAQRGNNPIGRAMREERQAPTVLGSMRRIEDMVFATRLEADEVLRRMYDVVEKYDFVTLNDLYTMVGWTANHVDTKWGWDSLQSSDIRRVREGYLLILPQPISLD
jgi:hypothetical protein